MPRRTHEPHTPHPPSRGPDRHGRYVHLPRQAPVVEGLGSMRPECDRGTGHCRIPGRPRPTVVSVAQVRLPGGVRVGNFPQNMQRRLRRQPPRLHHRIQRDLQRPSRPQSPRLRHPGNLVGNLIAQHQRRLQRRKLISSGNELDHHNPFHLAPTASPSRLAFTDPMCEQVMTEGSDKSRGQHLLNTMAKPSRAPTDPPTMQLCALVNSLTGVSTRRLRQAFPGGKCENLWSNHFCSPASTSTADPQRATHTAPASRHGLARRAGRHDALRGPGVTGTVRCSSRSWSRFSAP